MKEELRNTKKILLVGSACADVHLYIDHLPAKEEDLNAKRMHLCPGGCAFNAAWVLKENNVPFTFPAPNGGGMYGAFMQKALEDLGATPVPQTEDNGACFCLITPDGNRTFLTVHGAEYHFPKDLLKGINLKDYSYLYLSGIDLEEDREGVLMDTAVSFRGFGGTLFFAPGPRLSHLGAEVLQDLLSLQPLLHLNAREYSLLKEKLRTRPETLTGMPVIITDGPHPVELKMAAASRFFPTCRITQVDGTGAGDAHAGAVLAGLARGWSLADAIRFANRVSAARICAT